MNIQDIRKQYPQYNDLSDQELADGFHSKFYSDMPKSDFYSAIGLKVNNNGVWEGLVKPTLKASVKVPIHTIASMAQMPISGMAALGKLIYTGDLNEAGKVLEENQNALDDVYLTTPEERQGSANIGFAMKPFEMAGQGWKDIVNLTPLKGTIAEPIAGTIGEASAMFGFGGGGKAIKGRVGKNLAGLEDMKFEPKGQASITPEIGRIVHPEYVKGAFKREEPLMLPEASYKGKGQNFILEESKPETILRKGVKKGELPYTVGEINPDLQVINPKEMFTDKSKTLLLPTGQGFKLIDKVILRKGEPNYTIGEINPDLIVERKPFAKAEIKAEEPIAPVEKRDSLIKSYGKEITAEIAGMRKGLVKNNGKASFDKYAQDKGIDAETLKNNIIDYKKTSITKQKEVQYLKERYNKGKAVSEEPEAAIPKELEPLAEEARKYKTPEEFKNAIRQISKREKKLTKSEEELRSKIVTTSLGTTPLLEAYSKRFGDFNKTYIDFYNQAVKEKAGEAAKPTIPMSPEPGFRREPVPEGAAEGSLTRRKKNARELPPKKIKEVKTEQTKAGNQGVLTGLSETETFTLNNPQTEWSKPLPEQVKPRNEPLFDERGSFSLKYKNDVRDSLKQSIPENTPAGKVNSMYERTEVKRANREAITYKKVKDGLVRSIVDVSGNLKRELINKDYKLGKQVVIDRELLSGASAKSALQFEEASTKIFDGLRPDEMEVLNRVIQSRRIIDIDNYKTGVKHPEGLTGKEHAEYLTSIEKANPELYRNLSARADEYFNTMRNQVAELQKEGILSPEAATELMKHEYSPRRFFQYLDPENSFNFGGRKITVPDSGIKALDEGSLELLENNSQRLMAEVVTRTQARIFRNRANKSLYDFAQNVPDNGIVRIAKEVRKTQDGKPVYEDTPGGFEKVKVMIDGQPKEMIMPWEMAQEWVKSDPLINETLATVIGTISGAKILRPIATGYNPAFALTNIPRDVALIWSSSMQYSKHLPVALAQGVKDFIKVAPDVMKRKGRVRDYIDEGGGINFMTYYGRFSGKGYIGEKLNSFGKIMGWVGETSEIWSRMALRERAIQNGLSPKEATWEARRYLDFNQGGNVIKGLDTAIPYLNAAVQGTRGLLRGAKNNPAVFAYKMAQLGTVSSSLYLANYLTNPECWKSISDRDKEANFIITTPIYFTDDKGQKKYYYMKIAKDQGQRVVTSLFDAVMARQFEGKLPTKQVFMGIQDFISVAGIPPTLAAAASYMLNKDTWTNEDVWKGPEGIEPKEEYRNSTHPFWVSIGQSIGLSPERLSNAAGKIIPPNNPFVGVVGGGYKIATGDLPQEIQDKSAMQFITEIPSVRRVLSTTNPYTPYKENLKEVKTADDTQRFIENRTFDKMAEKYLKDQSNAQDIINYVSKLPEPTQDRLTRRMENMIKFRNIPDRSWWINVSSLSPEAKALVFWDRYLKADNTEKERMLDIADNVGGFTSDRFMDKLEEIVSGHTQGALSSQL